MMDVFHLYGHCAICLKPYNKIRGPTIHHKWYIDDDVRYKQYPRTTTGRNQYHADLLPLINENPERFVLLCSKCHVALTRLGRYSPTKLDRMLALIDEGRSHQ